jgi:hypothetical protein
MTDPDPARVIEWMNSSPRKPANLAFTDGPERQAAYLIEMAESRVRTEVSERLEEIQKDLEEIVISDGLDQGVILLDHESPTDWSEERQCFVYRHENFSPLGDALINLHRKILKLGDVHV